jgi:hypothetical protein
MKAFMHKPTEQIIEYFRYIEPYLKVPANEDENQKLIEFTRTLKKEAKHDKNHAVTSLLS